jgi:peptidoglycan hydrolase-like protein with peptidoglycan-binding domain
VFKIICSAVVVCIVAAAATTTNSDATKKKTSKRPAVHTGAAAHPTSATKAPAKASTKTAAKSSGTVAARSKTGKGSVRPKGAVRSFQQAPTPERYKEIQQALIGKGYLQGEATGEWGPDCVDALRRFQTDQNLTADGKIGSLSLIALGLGPKRLTAQTAPQPPAAEPPK